MIDSRDGRFTATAEEVHAAREANPDMGMWDAKLRVEMQKREKHIAITESRLAIAQSVIEDLAGRHCEHESMSTGRSRTPTDDCLRFACRAREARIRMEALK